MTGSTRRLGVLGTLVWDRIWHRNGTRLRSEPLEEWGGIAYSLSALAAACPPGWEIVPIIRIGKDLAAEARSFLRTIPGLDLEHAVRIVPEPNNRVELRYIDEARRCERLTGGVPPWSWTELAPLVRGLDALYINFISGFELCLPDAQRLRAEYDGPIYTDIHSLLLGRAPDGRRVPRPLRSWRQWLRCFDAVQLNEDELATLAATRGDPWKFAADVLAYETGLVLVTLGADGAAYLAEPGMPDNPLRWPEHRGSAVCAGRTIRTGRVPQRDRPGGGDPTGCGDVWGSTVFASLLAGCPLEEAIGRAHAAAARNVAHYGTAGLPAHLRGGLQGPGVPEPRC